MFNDTLLLDLMTLDQRTVLHIVCKDTLFSSAAFLKREGTEDVWLAYLRCWSTKYVGHPKMIHADRGPQFDSKQWRSLLHAAKIKQKESGIESHNALGAGERYHEFLRRIYLKVRHEHPRVEMEDCLSLAIQAMNNTAGPNGLSPTLLVFGIAPRIPENPTDLPSQEERMRALQKAQSEMNKATATARIRTALNRNVPAAADRDIAVGTKVLFYREKTSSWQGPYTVVARNNKSVLLTINGDLKRASIDKVRTCESMEDAEDPITAGKLSESEQLETSKAFDRAISGETFITYLHNTMNAICSDAIEAELDVHHMPTLISERVPSDDPRSKTPAFTAAKEAEVNGLLKRSVWEVVDEQDLEPDANIIGARFDLTLKNAGTKNEKPKARFVGQGYNDRMKEFAVHNCPTLRQSSTRFLLSIAAVSNYRISMVDFVQAYLQASEKLDRNIYLRVLKEDRELFGITEGQFLKLLKPLYGICDSGDYWAATFTHYVTEVLKMTPLDGDPSMYQHKIDGETEGLLGAYVDDNLFVGSDNFEDTIHRIAKKFESKPIERDHVEFVGINIRTVTEKDGSRTFLANQQHYLAKLKTVPLDSKFEFFRSVRSCVSWLTHTRPDLCCTSNRASQVTKENFSVSDIKQLNDAINCVKNSPRLTLKYPKLDHDTLHLRAYADASFASNKDLTSQLGYLILLCDGNNRCHVINYASRKSRRVVKSIMAGEVYAFSAAFDVSFLLKHDMDRVLNRLIPLHMFTDSKQMFDVITSARHTTEKRLMIDITAARQSYERFEIHNVGLVPGKSNPADGFTKPNPCNALREILKSGIDETPVSQWVIRRK